MMNDTSSDPFWYMNAVFYEVYVRAYADSNGDGHGDLLGLISRLDYIRELGVDCIWLLPIYPSPLKDDGYDIADFYGILPEYGTLEDFQELLREVHKREMRLITDLVLNHTSDQHAWFQEGRKDLKSPFRDYYVWSDTDKKYEDARIIFLDTEKSNWTWDETAGKFYWHRFYSSQPDLNYDNQSVKQEMLDVIRFWLELGVDGFRVDAVPYLIEREGTNCENLPETHQYLKTIRKIVESEFPGKPLLCEANQWPEDVREYFGEGDEFHMGFHFPLMPRIFMSLKKEDRTPIIKILERTPEIPETCQWCTFLRNHDELTLEMVTDDEREWMWREYAPEDRMRLNLGIRRRLAPLLDGDQRKIELAYSLLFSLPGSPVIYYGDEIGMGDDIWMPDRNGVRTPMQWDRRNNAGFSSANPQNLYSPVIQSDRYSYREVNASLQQKDPDSLLSKIKKMIDIRKDIDAFGWGDLSWLDLGDDKAAAYIRTYKDCSILIINNLSGEPLNLGIRKVHIQSPVQDLLSDGNIGDKEVIKIPDFLNPYEYTWLRLI
jgi:maltose alpha-D-glucosyltransferase/alpha-amylase